MNESSKINPFEGSVIRKPLLDSKGKPKLDMDGNQRYDAKDGNILEASKKINEFYKKGDNNELIGNFGKSSKAESIDFGAAIKGLNGKFSELSTEDQKKQAETLKNEIDELANKSPNDARVQNIAKSTKQYIDEVLLMKGL